MKITISGSMQHINAMHRTQRALQELDYIVEMPTPRDEDNYDTLSDEEIAKRKDAHNQEHMAKILSSDALLVLNEEKRDIPGYIGGNTLMEMTLAYQQGMEIFLLHTIPNISYRDEILGMKPMLLNGTLEAIDTYFKELPKTFVSSNSPIKLRAISRGMRKAGIRTQVIGRATNSGISEQPRHIEETHEGALNRHNQLKKALQGQAFDYLATIEEGQHALHKNHNVFACKVVILEKMGSDCKIGVTVDLELPKSMTDKAAAYPDLGVYIQQEYGLPLKDPYPFFTNGKLTRLKLTEDAVFNVASQL